METGPPFDAKAMLARLHQRRDFLKLFGRGVGLSAVATLLPACGGSNRINAPDPIPDPVPMPAIPLASREYTVLKRTSFGVKTDALAAMDALGIDAYLEQQLNYQSIADGTLEADIQAQFPLSRQTPLQLIAGFPDNIFNSALQMIAATQYRQVYSERQLYEVMVEFWTDHFNIHLLNGLGPTLKPEDDQLVIRTHALGNFKDLLYASAKSPAMLFYLDNFFNQASAPNENYARELMELHTLGVDGGYDEDDVKAVARCFTGWTLRFPDDGGGDYGTYQYVDLIHDKDAKLLLGNIIVANGAENDGEQVLDILAAHPSTASFIATKLCRRFINDDPEQATIDAVAAAFTSSNGDIKDSLRALFASSEFQNSADQKFTRPSEFLAGMVRALAPNSPYPSDSGQLWFFAQSILGQTPFYWPTPDGYPDHQSYWASTGGLLNRWRLSFFSFDTLVNASPVHLIDYLSMLAGADTIAGVLGALEQNILMRPLLDDHRQVLIDWLVSEYGFEANESLPTGIPEQASALIAAVLISSVYFHLR